MGAWSHEPFGNDTAGLMRELWEESEDFEAWKSSLDAGVHALQSL